jgi:Epoxide hydrolase N terminus
VRQARLLHPPPWRRNSRTKPSARLDATARLLASSSHPRRTLVVISVAASAFGLVLLAVAWHAQTVPAAEQITPSKERKPMPDTSDIRPGDTSIRPFEFHASDEALADLRRRIAATKWPSRELVTDASQGVQLATMRELASYWQTKYDWRKFEARLDAPSSLQPAPSRRALRGLGTAGALHDRDPCCL